MRDCEVSCGLICYVLNMRVVVVVSHSSVYSVHNAPGQPYRGQHHPLLVPA